MSTTPLAPTVSQPNGNNNPPPDCPQLVEQLAEYVDEADMFAHCLVFLIGEIPRTDAEGAERALKRVGRMAEHVAKVATTAALQAHAAVEIVRGSHGGSNGNGGGQS